MLETQWHWGTGSLESKGKWTIAEQDFRCGVIVSEIICLEVIEEPVFNRWAFMTVLNLMQYHRDQGYDVGLLNFYM